MQPREYLKSVILTSVVRIFCLRECVSDSCFVLARVPTYASNFLTGACTSVMEGTPMTGALMATCGDYLHACFGALRPAALSQWRSDFLWHPPFTSDVDIGPWAWAPLPTSGESGISAIKNPVNTGIRTKHPIPEVRAHIAKRRKYINRNFRLDVRLLQLDLGSSECQLPGSSEPPRRSGSAAAYEEIRESHTAEEKPRDIEERRTRSNITDRQQEIENANDGAYLEANSLQPPRRKPTHPNKHLGRRNVTDQPNIRIATIGRISTLSGERYNFCVLG